MLLKCHPSLSSSQRPAARGGWTLAEMLVAVGAGTVILLAFVSAFVTLSNTMVAIDNYNDLDQSSRHTLDLMNEDLRNTATVTNITYTSITATNIDTSGVAHKVTYWWDSSTSAFTRQFDGVNTVLLTNCDYLTFAAYTRVPAPGFTFQTNNTGDPTKTKLVSVSWRCSRTVLGIKLNTESVQTARICIRN